METEIVVALVTAAGTIGAGSATGYLAARHRTKKSEARTDDRFEKRIAIRDQEISDLNASISSYKRKIDAAFDRLSRTLRRVTWELEDHDPTNPLVREADRAIDQARNILAD